MSDPFIVPSFALMLQAFAPCFTAPSFSSFVSLMSGWVLNLRRHTVTQTVQAAHAVGDKHISSVRSRRPWVPCRTRSLDALVRQERHRHLQ